MNERISTRDLAELLTGQIGLDKKRAEDFLKALSSYILQSIERNKVVRIIGLGTFKVVLVRERESVHIQTGERFVIPAHHKLSFVPDRDLKEQINRPFAFFEPIETSEIHVPKKVTIRRDNDISPDKIVNNNDKVIDPATITAGNETIEEKSNIIIEDYFEFEEKDDTSGEDYNFEEEIDYDTLKEIPKTTDDSENDEYDESVYEELREITPDNESQETTEAAEVDDLAKDELTMNEDNTDEDDYVQTVAIGDDEEFEEPELSTEELNTEEEHEELNTEEGNMRVVKGESVDTEYIAAGAVTEKRIFAPLWLWIVLGCLLIVLGLGTGTFAFLYYNSGNNIISEQSFVDSNFGSKAESGSPSPIGGLLMPDENVIDSSELANGFIPENVIEDSIVAEKDSILPDTNAIKKKDEKIVIDWLAPSPERSKTETKRADKPNEKIESKNKELAKNSNAKTSTTNSRNTETTTKTTTATTETAVKEKIIPKQVRMQSGSSLTQIALEYYGDKTFWVYIYEHNKSKIKDFNNVPAGTELSLPLPSTYGINAKSKSSVDKAKQKQAQLLNWDVYN